MTSKRASKANSTQWRQGQRGPRTAAHPAVRSESQPVPVRGRSATRIAWIAAIAVAATIIAGGVVWLIHLNAAPLPGTVYESQGNTHINPGDTHPEYNSDPPTSGWHYPVPPQRGIYATPLPEELLLHFMEHAGVVVHYNPDVLPPDEVQQLHDIVSSELNKGQGLVLMAPDPLAPQAVALTAWQHLQTFTRVSGNKSQIQDFSERLQCNYDPESICGPAHGKSFQAGPPAPGVPTVVSPPMPANVPLQTAPMR